jgi:anti-sigma B factor antagonist
MSSEESLQITTRQGADRIVFELEGEIDLLNAPVLESALEQAGLNGAGGLVLDLRKVTFIDSTGLRTIFAVRNQARERGQAFAVTPGSEQVQRLLAVTRLGEHLRTIPTPDEALA